MYYMIKTIQEEKVIEAPSLSAALGELAETIRADNLQARLFADGKEILHGYMRGNEVILNWRVT